MTAGDEEAESLVDNLFRDVDDQFKDLEREYNDARQDLVEADADRQQTVVDPLEASNERYELMSQVASLQAELSRRADELDERDRMLAQLGDRIAGFEADIAQGEQVSSELHAAQNQVLEERREQARLKALLDARAAERQELADVASRLQNERDHVQDLLTTALERFDQVDAVRIEMDDKLRHLEAAQETAAREHDARAHELIESRAEMSKLADQLNELSDRATQAEVQAEKSEALAERRANEAGYLNRRIDAMTDKVTAAEALDGELADLRRNKTLNERRITELERELAAQQAEAAASAAAVEAIAERSSEFDELSLRVVELERERDEAWEAASRALAATPGAAAVPAATAEPVEAVDAVEEVQSLAEQARELGGRRAVESEPAAELVADPDPEDDLSEIDQGDTDVIDADLARIEAEQLAEQLALQADLAEFDAVDFGARTVNLDADENAALPDPPPPPLPPPPPAPEVPPAEVVAAADEVASAQALLEDPTVAAPALPDPPAVPRIPDVASAADLAEAAAVEAAAADAVAADAVAAEAAPEEDIASPESASSPAEVVADQTLDVDTADAAPAFAFEAETTALSAVRKRTILPADLTPNTPEAVAHLLNQPGVTAIVDARSTCGRTGIRPSELFDRVAALRDHFDVPVEVVVTPVSTPVGGAPDLPAIGVHHVTGADTVADRIRGLCMGFPADQPLVVIAGDDHVRRAAIGEEANVVEPAAVLNIAAE